MKSQIKGAVARKALGTTLGVAAVATALGACDPSGTGLVKGGQDVRELTANMASTLVHVENALRPLPGIQGVDGGFQARPFDAHFFGDEKADKAYRESGPIGKNLREIYQRMQRIGSIIQTCGGTDARPWEKHEYAGLDGERLPEDPRKVTRSDIGNFLSEARTRLTGLGWPQDGNQKSSWSYTSSYSAQLDRIVETEKSLHEKFNRPLDTKRLDEVHGNVKAALVNVPSMEAIRVLWGPEPARTRSAAKATSKVNAAAPERTAAREPSSAVRRRGPSAPTASPSARA
jgi:hypothetical protein